MSMTAAEVRACGDATAEQRAELRRLIDSKVAPADWVQRFYDDVRDAGGLSTGVAEQALAHLRRLAAAADNTAAVERAVPATAEQAEKLRELIRTRIVPGYLSRLWRSRLDAGQMSSVDAARAIKDHSRLPLRTFVPAGPQQTTAVGLDAPDGYFGLTTNGDVRCYRIHTLNSGQRVVEQFTGDKATERRRVRGWQITEVLRAVGADVPSAARLFATARKRCSDCNKPLHNENQPGWPHGVGPDCWDKRVAASEAAQDTTDPGADGDPATPSEGEA